MLERTTVLDIVDTVLNSAEIPNGEIFFYYALMVTNEHVVQSALKPSFLQFRSYFENLKRGFEYARNTYGEVALPSKLVFYQGSLPTNKGAVYDFIGYMPEDDNLGISLLHIAGQCAFYGVDNTGMADSHLPPGKAVKPEDETTLQAIEESFHKYQLHELGYAAADTRNDKEHPYELEVKDVFVRAISDLGIPLFEAPNSPYLGTN